MGKYISLLAKWSIFWTALDNAEKLLIIRMIGYRGKYPTTGVSPLLMARLLQINLKRCHKRVGGK